MAGSSGNPGKLGTRASWDAAISLAAGAVVTAREVGGEVGAMRVAGAVAEEFCRG